MSNLILLTDSYKFSHAKQYPPHTEKVYSYFESRGGAFHEAVFFGLQYYLKKYLEGPVITREKVEEAYQMVGKHLGNYEIFNKAGWIHIVERGGRLPISIKAVPEGTVVPGLNVLMTVENTDPHCYWLTNYLETLLVQTWYGTTVATQSREMKKLILKYLEETGDPALIDFKLHDFGFRGVSSVETAGVGGAAHLISFKGTDTFEGITVARDYYHEPMAGFSIPAAEHSTIISWGRVNEVEAMENMLVQYPQGLVAVVSDSFDIFEACKNIWGGKLKAKVMARNGTVVIRPDSGDPVEVLVNGIPNVFSILGEKFGFAINAKGYRVLDSHIRMIQGDNVDFAMLDSILNAMEKKGWSADNLSFGAGGSLLQKLNRDTLQFAFKCSSCTVNGVERDVYKSPITDRGKNSKAGRLKLVSVEGAQGSAYVTRNQKEPGKDELVEVFRDGSLLKDWRFSEIRERAKISV